jgi:hypothetical protein
MPDPPREKAAASFSALSPSEMDSDYYGATTYERDSRIFFGLLIGSLESFQKEGLSIRLSAFGFRLYQTCP